MILQTTIGGRPATAAYLDNNFEPVDDENLASVVKVIFDDEQGGVMFLVPQSHSNILGGALKSYDRFVSRKVDYIQDPTTGRLEGSHPGPEGGTEEHTPVGTLSGHFDPKRLTGNTIKSETPALKPRSSSVPKVAHQVNARANDIWKSLGIASGKVESSHPTTDDMIANVFAQEIKDGLANSKADPEWYKGKMKEAMRIARLIHPEIAKDKDKQFAFIVALAVTSQGQRVGTSANLAEAAYEHFEKTGKFPDRLPVNKPVINENFGKLNDLIKQMGSVAKVKKFFDKQMPAGDLQAILNGRKPGTGKVGDDIIKIGSINRDTPVYGSAMLGPKIGEGFYQNLSGNFKPVTMDMWFMRTWGRITGTGIGGPQPDYDRLRRALAAENKPVPDTEEKLLDLAREINDANDKAFKKLTKTEIAAGSKRVPKTADQKTEADHAAERIVLAEDNGMVEQPGNGSKREWMTKVFLSALDKLKKEGINITPAAAQATIWDPEKVMYFHLGARAPEEADYAKVLRAIAEAKGIAV